jgi:hypothetical protein
MKTTTTLLAIAATLACVTAAAEKNVPIGGFDRCNEAAGEALACVIQCDPGTRPAFGRYFSPARTPGVEACRVFNCACTTVVRAAGVIFGADFLLGVDQPAIDFGARAPIEPTR